MNIVENRDERGARGDWFSRLSDQMFRLVKNDFIKDVNILAFRINTQKSALFFFFYLTTWLLPDVTRHFGLGAGLA